MRPNMDCFRPLLSFIDQNHVTDQLDVMMNFQSFSADNFFPRQESDVVGNLHHAGDNLVVSKAEDEVCETKKRKASRKSSSTTSSLGKNEVYNGSSRGKKVKKSGNEEEKVAKEVDHVRARRGQATDSHSLAERVRRGKINEKLRCLQGIVPGCYKSMGMAVMLDEIINYVQSLQHQVEFLSMKLSTASSYYDFNSDTNCMEMMQAAEAEEVERLMREGYGGASKSTTTTIWPY